MTKEPDTEAEFKAYYKKIFAPENFDRPEYHEMSADELRAKLAEIRETRKRIGLQDADMDEMINKLWLKKTKALPLIETVSFTGMSEMGARTKLMSHDCKTSKLDEWAKMLTEERNYTPSGLSDEARTAEIERLMKVLGLK